MAFISFGDSLRPRSARFSDFQRDRAQRKSQPETLGGQHFEDLMPSPLASAFLPLLVLFPIYITLNVTFLGDYSESWLLLSLACGIGVTQPPGC